MTVEWQKRAAVMYRAGFTVREIEGALGVSFGRVRRALIAAGVPLRPRARRPQDRSADAGRAAQLRAAGVSVRAVASALGVSEAVVRRLLAQASSGGAA